MRMGWGRGQGRSRGRGWAEGRQEGWEEGAGGGGTQGGSALVARVWLRQPGRDLHRLPPLKSVGVQVRGWRGRREGAGVEGGGRAGDAAQRGGGDRVGARTGCVLLGLQGLRMELWRLRLRVVAAVVQRWPALRRVGRRLAHV